MSQSRPLVRTLLSRITRFFKPPEPEYQHNTAWNDPINKDAEGLFRLYFQNVHGLSRDMVTLHQDLETLRDFDVSCFCLAEINMDWQKPHVKMDFLSQQRLVWKGLGGAKSAMSSIALENTSDFLTGGTVTSAVGHWCTRVLHTESDPSGMGRWSSVTFIGRQHRRITVVTGYRCVRSSGDNSVWSQEKIFLRAKLNKNSPHPRRQFIYDLSEYLNEKRRQGHDLIVALDANEVIGEESCGISKLMHDCGLFDLLDIPADDASIQLKDTFRRGTNRRIDYILGTERVLESARRRGALAYNDGIVSDHRGLFVDFDPSILLGGTATDPVALSNRGFTSKNAKTVTKYVDHLERYWEDHKISGRIQKLQTEAKQLTRTAIRTRFDAIDRDITRGMLAAEKKVRHADRKYHWSKQLDQAGYALRYWQTLLSDRRCNSSDTPCLDRVRERAGIDQDEDHSELSIETITRKIATARKDLKEMQRQDKANRHKNLHDRLKEAEKEAQDSDDPEAAQKAAKAIEAIIRSEHRQEAYDRIKRAIKGVSGTQGLDRLDVPKRTPENPVLDSDNQDHQAPLEAREILLEVDDIHKALLDRNKNHFHQAAETPFGHGILHDLVGYSGLNEAATEIVNGTFLDNQDVPDLLPETRQMIVELAMPDQIKSLRSPIPTEITAADFISGFKKWKERTATSPSGRHLGHYKAIIRDAEDSEVARSVDPLTDLVTMTNIPLKYGFAPSRWCKSVSVMLAKDPGSSKIERLRVIHLFEADYNLTLKLLWGKRLVHRGEDNKCFGHQQFARPGHQCIDAVHKKILTYDMARIQATNLAVLDNDATGCYDRIIVALGMIAALRLGMPRNAVRMHAQALAKMQYFVKTAHGISEAFYRSVKEFLLFGTGQGSGASPSVWLTLVVCLLSALSAIATVAMTFADPWQDLFDKRNADAFVDDSANGVSDAHQEVPMPVPEIVGHLQHTAQTWERILFSSGGSLNIPKCFWYLVYWEWPQGRPTMMNSVSAPGIVALTQGNSPVYSVVQRKETWEAMRTLGVRVAPDGNFKKEASFLQTKAENFARRLLISRLSRLDTYIFHRSTYVPAMTYSSCVTTMDPATLNNIQRKAICAILEKLGVNCKFPRRVTFGSKELCGLGLLDLSIEQGVRQISHFLDHVFAQDSIGNMILIELRHLQLESGSGIHLLEFPSVDFPYLTPCWLISMREFMARHSIQLTVAKARAVPLAREHDSYLMDVFRELPNFSGDDLYDINRVRIFLQVTTLSDITDGSGKNITEDAYEARPMSDRKARLRWPRQLFITTKQRNLWKKAIESAYTSWGRKLHQPLGQWTAPPNQIWSGMYDKTSDTITIKDTQNSSNQYYLVQQSSRWSMTALELEHVPEDRVSATDNWRNHIPVTLEKVFPPSIRVSLHPPISTESPPTRQQPHLSNFKDYIATLPEITRRLLLSCEFVPGGERTLRECLANNSRLRAASDGSLDPDAEIASFGWQLLGNGNVLVRGAGPVDGAPDLLSSTRAELFGISAVLEFIYHFGVFANLNASTSKVILWVDNKAAITKVNRTRKTGARRRRLCHDADIICQITDRLDRLPLKIRLQWVKSHQDRKTPYRDLDMAGRMNVDADSLAESFRCRMTEDTFRPIRQGLENPLTAVTLLIDGVRISSHYSHSIRSTIQKKKHRSYLQEKHKWSDTDWQAIDLAALKSAFLTLEPMKRISCSKRIHGWLNTGAQKAHISPEAPESHKCPRCHLAPETPEHVLRCTHSSAHKRRYELIPPMQRRMLTVPGCRVQQIFFDCLRSWLANPDNITPDISHLPIEQRGLVETALSEQAAIGWDMCFRGYLSRHWALAVSANPRLSKHDKQLPLNRSDTGKTWARKVISQLWDFAHEMWLHRNSFLHDTTNIDCQQMKGAAVDAAITALYSKVESYAAEDRWRFDMPLSLRLRTPLRSRRRWLTLTRILVEKSSNYDSKGQRRLTTFFKVLRPRRSRPTDPRS